LNLVVETAKARLPLGHNLQLERALPIARRRQPQLAEIVFQRPAVLSITRIASVLTCRIVPLIAEMIAHLRFQRP